MNTCTDTKQYSSISRNNGGKWERRLQFENMLLQKVEVIAILERLQHATTVSPARLSGDSLGGTNTLEYALSLAAGHDKVAWD